jgi:alpha-amylase/alpha-mannosidase (GH57 family)
MEAFIYSLETDGVVWYVGHTIAPERRMKEHINKKDVGLTSSKLIPAEYVYDMKILEVCEKTNRFYIERKWYDILKPLCNTRTPRLHQYEIDERNRAYMERVLMGQNDHKL